MFLPLRSSYKSKREGVYVYGIETKFVRAFEKEREIKEKVRERMFGFHLAIFQPSQCDQIGRFLKGEKILVPK